LEPANANTSALEGISIPYLDIKKTEGLISSINPMRNFDDALRIEKIRERIREGTKSASK
jgi:hypothetical protein